MPQWILLFFQCWRTSKLDHGHSVVEILFELGGWSLNVFNSITWRLTSFIFLLNRFWYVYYMNSSEPDLGWLMVKSISVALKQQHVLLAPWQNVLKCRKIADCIRVICLMTLNCSESLVCIWMLVTEAWGIMPSETEMALNVVHLEATK